MSETLMMKNVISDERIAVRFSDQKLPLHARYGELYVVDGILFVYVDLDGTGNGRWFPLTDKKELYTFTQIVEDTLWTIPYTFQTDNLKVIAYDHENNVHYIPFTTDHDKENIFLTFDEPARGEAHIIVNKQYEWFDLGGDFIIGDKNFAITIDENDPDKQYLEITSEFINILKDGTTTIESNTTINGVLNTKDVQIDGNVEITENVNVVGSITSTNITNLTTRTNTLEVLTSTTFEDHSTRISSLETTTESTFDNVYLNINNHSDRLISLETLTSSDDIDLDTIQEVVNFIKANRDTLDSLSFDWLSITDKPTTISGYGITDAVQEGDTVTLTGDVTGTASFDTNGDVSIVTTVVDDSHNHIMGDIDGLGTYDEFLTSFNFELTDMPPPPAILTVTDNVFTDTVDNDGSIGNTISIVIDGYEFVPDVDKKIIEVNNPPGLTVYVEIIETNEIAVSLVGNAVDNGADDSIDDYILEFNDDLIIGLPPEVTIDNPVIPFGISFEGEPVTPITIDYGFAGAILTCYGRDTEYYVPPNSYGVFRPKKLIKCSAQATSVLVFGTPEDAEGVFVVKDVDGNVKDYEQVTDNMREYYMGETNEAIIDYVSYSQPSGSIPADFEWPRSEGFYAVIDEVSSMDISSVSSMQPFETIWDFAKETNTDSDNRTVKFGLGVNKPGKFYLEIDWGDGTVETITERPVDDYVEHTYFDVWVDVHGTTPTIKAKGYFSFLRTNGDSPRLTEIISYGTVPFQNCMDMFWDDDNPLDVGTMPPPNLSECFALDWMFQGQNTAGLSNFSDWDLSSVRSVRGMFKEADVSGITTALDSWDTSNIVDMGECFKRSTGLTTQGSNWDTSRVMYMDGTFYDSDEFNADVSSWDTSRVLTMLELFCYAYDFTSDVSAWETSTVNNMESLFYACYGWNSDVSGWDTSNVTEMGWMFGKCRSFNQSVSNFDTSLVETMTKMFYQCYVFNQPVDNFDTSKVTDMRAMFGACYEFNQSVSSFDTTLVTDMSGMFSECYVFNQPVDNFDTSLVTTMEDMFWDAWFFNQSVDSFNTENVESMKYMFENAGAFNHPVNHFDVGNVVTFAWMFDGALSFNQSLSSWVTTSADDFEGMFYEAEVFNGSISSFDTTNVTDMSYMFESALKFNQPVNHFDTTNVTTMHRMFSNCEEFNQPVSNFNTSNVADMGAMFNDCMVFNQSVSNFNTSKVNDMHKMFEWCHVFNQSVSSFDTNLVNDMNNMFDKCYAFNQPVNHFDTSRVTDMERMFCSCHSFNQPISNFDTSNVDTFHRMFEECYVFDQDVSCMVPASANETDYYRMFADCYAFRGIGVENWDVSNATTLGRTFNDCTVFNADLSTWDTSSVEDLDHTFSGAESFTGVGLQNWVTSSNTTLEGTFRSCDVFNADISGWDTSQVTTMFETFFGTQVFNQPIGSWDTSNVENMRGMFNYIRGFNQPINNWNTSSVTDMGWMFQDAKPFLQSLSSWDTSNVEAMDYMLWGAGDWDYNQNLSGWNVSNVTNCCGFTGAVEFLESNRPNFTSCTVSC